MADSDTVIISKPVVSLEEVQRDWTDLKTRVGQLEGERALLERENKTLRLLLERVVEHRQRSHGELILLLTGLVSKLPISDVGVVVSKLIEHNANVAEVCAALSKGSVEAALPQPTVLKNLEQVKRDIAAALKPAVDELIQSDPPLETTMLKALVANPESFYSPVVQRANRCYVKGQVTRERVVREFGEEVLPCFNDLTTDPKLNPRPKADEIVLAFKQDFEAVLQQNPGLGGAKRADLIALHQKIVKSRSGTESARVQKNLFLRISFLLELLHYYEHQSTEAPDVIFAQRLPALVEQFAVAAGDEKLDEKWIAQVEGLLAFVLAPDHRVMVINNVGKSGGLARTLRFVLRLRIDRLPDENEVVHDFIRHLIQPPPQPAPTPKAIAEILRLVGREDRQKTVSRAIMGSDRMKRVEAELLGRAVAVELGVKGVDEEVRPQGAISPEMERQLAWERVKELITRRAEPSQIAAAIRDRLHLRYDGDELRQSWITLNESEPILFIRVFCQLPYLADGRTDSIARALLESFVTRLTHEKYAATYAKVMTSLKNMFKAKPDSPMLLNFVALVKWVDAEAAQKISREVGLAA